MAQPDIPLTSIWQHVADWARRPPDDEAIGAVEALIPQGGAFWGYVRQFASLIVLSAAIASFGLLSDSSAVVIGAMLVAPLMTPITAAAAATVMARNARLVQSLSIIAFGTAAAIAVGWVSAAVSGITVSTAEELPGEVVARTFPGLLDLGVAITAGAAAGYILPRRSTTSALPGVGIAVALVPPLATVGITWRLGFPSESRNALLLYLTNLAAIIFTVSVMLIAVGFRPGVSVRRSLARRFVVTVGAVVAVAVPLTYHTQSALEDADLRRAVVAAVQDWDGAARVVELDASSSGNNGTVELLVSGPNPAPPAWRLAEQIQDRFGGAVDLRLLYEQDQVFEVSVR